MDERHKRLLEFVQPSLREEAASALVEGDVRAWLECGNPEKSGLAMVGVGGSDLRALGLYEEALLEAWLYPPVNHGKFPCDLFKVLFEAADADRMRAAGDPLPGPGPFTIYRGVAGRGPARRVRGPSWTGSQPRAARFAQCFFLADPAVYRLTIEAKHVVLYTNAREEQEFIVLLPEGARPVRVLEGQDVHRLADEYITARSHDGGLVVAALEGPKGKRRLELFREEHGRDPRDIAELAEWCRRTGRASAESR